MELEEGRTASSLMMGILRAGAGQAALRALAERRLPPGIRWDGKVLYVEGKLPAEGVVSAKLFENASLAVDVEHCPEGFWCPVVSSSAGVSGGPRCSTSMAPGWCLSPRGSSGAASPGPGSRQERIRWS